MKTPPYTNTGLIDTEQLLADIGCYMDVSAPGELYSYSPEGYSDLRKRT